MGSIAKRASIPKPSSLSAVIVSDAREYPDTPLLPDLERFRDTFHDDAFMTLCKVDPDLGFWVSMGLPSDASSRSWSDRLERCGLDSRLVELIATNSEYPTVRYRLETISDDFGGVQAGDIEQADDRDSLIEFQRTFRRTFTVPRGALSDWLRDIADSLPAPFDALRSSIRSLTKREKYIDLFDLPITTRPPIQVTWLASPRSASEIVYDFAHVIEDGIAATLDLLASEMEPSGNPACFIATCAGQGKE